MEAAHAALANGNAGDKVALEETPCAYICGVAPAVEFNGAWQGRVDVEDLGRILTEASS